MKKIELYPIREWQEKIGDKTTGRIYLYVGRIHIATCTRVKNHSGDIEKYHYEQHIDGWFLSFESKAKALEEIKSEIDASLKEFVSRVAKSVRTFKKVETS